MYDNSLYYKYALQLQNYVDGKRLKQHIRDKLHWEVAFVSDVLDIRQARWIVQFCNTHHITQLLALKPDLEFCSPIDINDDALLGLCNTTVHDIWLFPIDFSFLLFIERSGEYMLVAGLKNVIEEIINCSLEAAHILFRQYIDPLPSKVRQHLLEMVRRNGITLENIAFPPPLTTTYLSSYTINTEAVVSHLQTTFHQQTLINQAWLQQNQYEMVRIGLPIDERDIEWLHTALQAHDISELIEIQHPFNNASEIVLKPFQVTREHLRSVFIRDEIIFIVDKEIRLMAGRNLQYGVIAGERGLVTDAVGGDLAIAKTFFTAYSND